MSTPTVLSSNEFFTVTDGTDIIIDIIKPTRLVFDNKWITKNITIKSTNNSLYSIENVNSKEIRTDALFNAQMAPSGEYILRIATGVQNHSYSVTIDGNCEEFEDFCFVHAKAKFNVNFTNTKRIGHAAFAGLNVYTELQEYSTSCLKQKEVFKFELTTHSNSTVDCPSSLNSSLYEHPPFRGFSCLLQFLYYGYNLTYFNDPSLWNIIVNPVVSNKKMNELYYRFIGTTENSPFKIVDNMFGYRITNPKDQTETFIAKLEVSKLSIFELYKLIINYFKTYTYPVLSERMPVRFNLNDSPTEPPTTSDINQIYNYFLNLQVFLRITDLVPAPTGVLNIPSNVDYIGSFAFGSMYQGSSCNVDCNASVIDKDAFVSRLDSPEPRKISYGPNVKFVGNRNYSDKRYTSQFLTKLQSGLVSYVDRFKDDVALTLEECKILGYFLRKDEIVVNKFMVRMYKYYADYSDSLKAKLSVLPISSILNEVLGTDMSAIEKYNYVKPHLEKYGNALSSQAKNVLLTIAISNETELNLESPYVKDLVTLSTILSLNQINATKLQSKVNESVENTTLISDKLADAVSLTQVLNSKVDKTKDDLSVLNNKTKEELVALNTTTKSEILSKNQEVIKAQTNLMNEQLLAINLDLSKKLSDLETKLTTRRRLGKLLSVCGL